jgi:hypothetical protein
MPMARWKNRRAALTSRCVETKTSMTWAELVDGAVHVTPPPGYLDVGLVDPPAIADGVPARPGGLSEQRREPLHPAVDRDVVDLDPALGEELLDIAIRQAEA